MCTSEIMQCEITRSVFVSEHIAGRVNDLSIPGGLGAIEWVQNSSRVQVQSWTIVFQQSPEFTCAVDVTSKGYFMKRYTSHLSYLLATGSFLLNLSTSGFKKDFQVLLFPFQASPLDSFLKRLVNSDKSLTTIDGVYNGSYLCTRDMFYPPNWPKKALTLCHWRGKWRSAVNFISGNETRVSRVWHVLEKRAEKGSKNEISPMKGE